MSVQQSGSPRRHATPDRAAQLVAVQSFGFLGRLSPELAADLVSSGPLIRYPAGSGSAPTRDVPWAAVVVCGVVRQYMPMADGRQVTLRYARAGDLVCNSSAGSMPVSVEIEAVETSDLVHLDLARLQRTARLEPELSMAVEELSNRLQHAYRTLASNTFATVRSRVARDLLERSFEAEASRPGAHLRVTQQALADATGSVREVVARALRELRIRGLIKTDHSGITILDSEALIREAGQTI
jgi:CRP/FNR family transcriptional regulator, cyclic AMP receptor protein